MKAHRFSYLAFIAIIIFCVCTECSRRPVRVGYVIVGEDMTDEDRAVLEWLEDRAGILPRKVRIEEESIGSSDIDVYWIHMPDSSSYERWMISEDNLSAFASLFQHNVRFLLSGYAVLLPYDAGIESQKPEIRRISIWDDWLFDQKGLQSWRGHPVFTGLFGGAFIWDGFEDHQLPLIGYSGRVFPVEGKVVAVEKSYITIHGDHRLMMEYGNGNGRILSVGGFIHFSRKNRLHGRLARFVENCLFYLDEKKHEESATYWKAFDHQPKPFSIQTEAVVPARKEQWSNPPATDLVFMIEDPGEDFYDLAGRRALFMGREKAGIDEVWVHPFRVLRDFKAGIVAGDSILWLEEMKARVEIRPESIKRTYQSPSGPIIETVFPSMEKGGVVVRYASKGAENLRLLIQFRSDLRWMWPYDEVALGDVHFGYDDGLHALHVKDETGDFYCVFGADCPPEQHIEGQYEDVEWQGNALSGQATDMNQVVHATLFPLNESNNYSLHFSITGTDQGKEEALTHFRSLLENPIREYRQTVDHYRHLLNAFVTIESPDEEFNRLWKWALVGTDRFFVNTPTLGTALVAGYATTDKGWDGRHTISGRPGYGWYFGRDAAWSAFAVDDYGDFEQVREQLAFFQTYQDISGKIFHEFSTSGVIHYDAADATPLYIILAAHYLRGSGDIGFIRESWPHLKRAMDFLYTTDTDKDGLIENTNVGHGWVEGGKLWGAHTTFYLAGLWARSLMDMAYIGQCLGKREHAQAYTQDAERVQSTLNTDFWNDDAHFFYYGKLNDGSYNPEETILPAVVMYYGLLDDEKVLPVLDSYAGNGFTSDWGVRILSSASPLFNPRGYHYGSVWPLYTGWTALAEYTYGRSVQGFSHIYNNQMIKNHWAKGFVEEVMNGTVYEPSGVCPHQCWSETNVLHPGITGMIGWKPHALRNTAELKPRFPLHWDRVGVNNLRMGDAYLSMHMERFANKTTFTLSQKSGKPVTVHLYPEIPDGMIVEAMTVDGESVIFHPETHRGLLKEPVVFDVKDRSVVTLTHRHGIGMIPVMPRPSVGEESTGYRIRNARLTGNTYTVDLEGKSDTVGEFALRVFDQDVQRLQGGKIHHMSDGGVITLHVAFPPSQETFVQKQIKIVLD